MAAIQRATPDARRVIRELEYRRLAMRFGAAAVFRHYSRIRRVLEAGDGELDGGGV